MRLPGVKPGSIAWKAIILTVGLQTLLETKLMQCICQALTQQIIIIIIIGEKKSNYFVKVMHLPGVEPRFITWKAIILTVGLQTMLEAKIMQCISRALKKNNNKEEKKRNYIVKVMHLPGVKPGSIAWKAIILTGGLQTLMEAKPIQYICGDLIQKKKKIIIIIIGEKKKELFCKSDALAGSRTRVCCLEGNYPNAIGKKADVMRLPSFNKNNNNNNK